MNTPSAVKGYAGLLAGCLAAAAAYGLNPLGVYSMGTGLAAAATICSFVGGAALGWLSADLAQHWNDPPLPKA